jgi:DNA-binding transcriptional LysR family regulator
MLIKNALRQIDVQDMLVFAALLEQRNARRVAEALSLSPSTISYCLKRLRDCFADELFFLRQGAMSPTAKACAIAPYVQSAIDALNRCAAPAEVLLAEGRPQTFCLQAPEYFELLVLPLAVECLAVPFRVAFEMERLGPELPVERLLAGKLDLAVGFGPGYQRMHPELAWCALLDEDFVCLSSQDELRGEPLSLEDFLAHPHIAVAPWGATNNMIDAWLETLNCKRRIIARANGYQACLNILAQTPALFSLPRRLLPLLQVPARVQVFEPPLGFPGFTLDLIWCKRRAVASQWLRDRLSEVVKRVQAFGQAD